MSLNIKVPQPELLKPRITIFGVGGAGGNAINNMIRSDLEGVEFIAANTDAQALTNSLAPNRIQLGAKTTKGLGAGSFPEKGREAAEENIVEIEKYLEGSNMVFIAAGMGGGTGTGGAPVIARLAKERGVLTVGVVTKPFHFEGAYRMETAKKGIEELKKHVDTLIVIPNQNLFRIANEQTTFESAFKMADDVLHDGVRGVTDLITMPGIVNLDFADIRTVMTKMGKAMMGTGEAEGEDRAVVACEAAISNPLLDDISIKGAKGVLVNMTGGTDMTLFEADMAVNTIKKEVDSNANIIFGSAFNENMNGKIRISVVATGIDIDEMAASNAQDESSRFTAQKDSKEMKDLMNESSNNGFFDIGTAQKPDNDTIQQINEGDLRSKEEYSKEPNLEYGENNGERTQQVLESEFAQISFFSDNGDENKEQEEQEPKEALDQKDEETVENVKEEKSSKKKDGFKLFGFLNKKSKKVEEDEFQEEITTIEETKEEKTPKKEKKKSKLTQQEFFGTNFDDESETQESEELATKEESSGDEDDVLNVPAFFRRKS